MAVRLSSTDFYVRLSSPRGLLQRINPHFPPAPPGADHAAGHVEISILAFPLVYGFVAPPTRKGSREIVGLAAHNPPFKLAMCKHHAFGAALTDIRDAYCASLAAGALPQFFANQAFCATCHDFHETRILCWQQAVRQ